MRTTSLILSLLLNSYFHTFTTAQTSFVSSTSTSTSTISSTPISISQTPEMSASSVSSVFNALATGTPLQPGGDPEAGDAGSTAGAGDSAAGASGHDGGSFTLSSGAIIAIAVVAGVVCILGIISSVLWYFAKKRSWEVRATIRKSARRVATALTPRRTTFPKDARTPRRQSTRGLSRISEVPNTPRAGNNDLEKGNSKFAAFEMSEPPKAKTKWGKKNSHR